MSRTAPRTSLEPFLLEASGGPRFCVLHEPPAGVPVAGALVYLHPFADEMNKSRRMAAMQARRCAAMGIAVLQIDLFGCGDSSGEFGQASWEAWRGDGVLAAEWLERRTGLRPGLWGLRLGGALAAAVADDLARVGRPVPRIVLWQPVASGETHLTQFLRMKVAGDMIAAGAASNGTRALRDRLVAGESVEVAGYEVGPALAAQLDAVRIGRYDLGGASVDWIDVGAEAGKAAAPPAARALEAWTQAGSATRHRSVAGPAFWTSVEIVDCPALLDVTCADAAA